MTKNISSKQSSENTSKQTSEINSERISELIVEHYNLVSKIVQEKLLIKELERISNLIISCFKRGNKVLICGNGGSAADAQHFATELTARFETERKGLPTIALSTDTSFLTAWSNDYEFETIFSRQVEALGKEGDLLIGFSTSGNSKNIIKAMKTAKEQGLKTISFLGRDGGPLKDLADEEIIIPHNNTARIQEIHELSYHIICRLIDEEYRK